MKNYKKMFKDARETLKEREKEEPRDASKDWDETWPEYVKRKRHEGRQVLLNTLVPDRKCSLCNEIKLNSKQWVISTQDGKKFALCKSCWMKRKD